MPDTRQDRQRSKRSGYKRTRRPKKQNANLVSLAKLKAGKRPTYLPLLISRPATPTPAGEPNAPSESLLRLPHVLRFLGQWLRDRLLLSKNTARLMAFALLLPVWGCGTPPGQAVKENPFSVIPAQLLREPLNPLPLSPHLRTPSIPTPKTLNGAPKTSASS
jgi:hypothetical protein